MPALRMRHATIMGPASQTFTICDIARERSGLVEGHADPLFLAPDDVAGHEAECFCSLEIDD